MSLSQSQQPFETKCLTGVFERVLFSNDTSHFCVGELRTTEIAEPVTITGTLINVQCGETLSLNGYWSNHPKHGRQFKFVDYRSELPASVYGIRQYLGSSLVPGIGKACATKIVDRFGTNTLKVISEDSGRLSEVPGIGKQRARAIKKAWEQQQNVREVMMFLKTYGVGTTHCLRLVRKYGNSARSLLETAPYTIAQEIKGIGFKTMDKIALNLGIANNSPERLQAGLIHVLYGLIQEGHTVSPRTVLIEKTAVLLQADIKAVQKQLNTLIQNKLLILIHPDNVQSFELYQQEQTIAHILKALNECPSKLPPVVLPKAINWAQDKASIIFAPAQLEALRKALTHKIAIITGGPGTGKTTLLRAIVQILQAKKVRIALAAPTGRAAHRMSDSTLHTAHTLHRLLQFDPANSKFTYNQKQTLPYDFIIIDEASMLDTALAAALFQAISPSSHLLLVGDIHQLPSVGPGSILEDLIKSNLFAVTFLEEVFRQTKQSSITATAHAILKGIPTPPSIAQSLNTIDPQHDLHFIQAPIAEDCLTTIYDLIHKHIPHWYNVDPIMDIQVLAPLSKGTVGINQLNTFLQKKINSQQACGLSSYQYKMGDKVIQTRNNYDKGIYNGDLGVVRQWAANGTTLTVNFGGIDVDLESIDLVELQLAYSISIHKSQGSEFPIVIIPLLKQHFVMLRRNLLYTAITRGRRKVFIVGDPTAYAMAVRSTEATYRMTHLLSKLHQPSRVQVT